MTSSCRIIVFISYRFGVIFRTENAYCLPYAIVGYTTLE